MATAEFAVAVPAIVMVLVLGISALVTLTDQVKCVDAARATARLLARGDSQAAAVAQGRLLAPGGASIEVGGSGAVVSVRVVGRPVPPLAWLGSKAAPRGAAVAVREDALREDTGP